MSSVRFWNLVDMGAAMGLMVVLWDAHMQPVLPDEACNPAPTFDTVEQAVANVKVRWPEAVELESVRFDDYF
jgi:hypothetical protein